MKFLFLLLNITLAFHSGTTANAAENITIDLSLSTSRGDVVFEIHGERKDLLFLKRVEEILKNHAHPILEYFEYKPTTAIHFTLNKTATSANGSAAVFPRNLITLNTFPPYGNGHLVTGEDWLLGLVIHELVHIVHLDQTTGVPDYVRSIFGSIAKWGGIVPRWFSEGIAMWAETKFTQGGRLRNQMMFYELEARFSDPDFCQTIDCLDDPGKYPYGQYPYWIGGTFLSWLEDQKVGNISCLIKSNSDSIPFLLNDAFKECLGHDASSAFQLFRRTILSNVRKKDKYAHPLASNKQKLRFSTSEIPLFQKGWEVADNKLIFVEDNDRIEAMIIRDLFTGKSSRIRLPFHIEQIYSTTDENKKVILSNSRFDRYARKRSISTFNLETLQETESPYKGEYATVINNKVIHMKNKDLAWHIYREGEEVFSFPAMTQVNTVHYYKRDQREYLSAKIVNPGASSKYQLWVVELGGNDVPSKAHTLWESKAPYDLLLQCDGSHLIRSQETLYGLELTALDQRRKRSVKLPWIKEIAQIRGDKSNTVVLLSNRPGFAYVQEKGCREFTEELLYESKPYRSKTLKENLAKDEVEQEKETETLSSYPRLSHFLPHWWAFSYYAGSQLANWQVNTSVNDPRNKHSISFALKYFPDLAEASPSGVYNYNFGSNNLGFGYDRTYINSSLKISPDLTESKYVYLSRMMKRWGWNFVPRISHNQKVTQDIFGKRNITNTSLYTVLFKEPLFADSFFKHTSIYANAYYEEIENIASFWANEFKLKETLQPFRRFYLHLQGSYAKLYNDSFLEGVVYSGGYDDYSVSSFHPFYGISVNDAYGREVKTYRAQMDATIAESYRGMRLFPVFIKTLSLLAGMEYLETDRIYLSETKQFIVNDSVSGAHIGLRARTTIAYFVPVEFDTIINQTQNPIGRDYTSYLFLMKASFFL